MNPANPITNHGRIRRAAFFILLALAAEAASLYWKHPLSFYVFVVLAALLGILGTVSFLLSLVSPEAQPQPWAPIETVEREREAAEG